MITPPGLVRRLPLRWKFLTPFLVLILVVGPLAGFLIARDLSSRADAALDRDLLDGLLGVRARSHDRSLYVLESATLAANLQGMADAAARGDQDEVSTLLRSVLAVKTDLTFLAIVGPDRVAMAATTRSEPGGDVHPAETVAAEDLDLQAVLDGRSDRSAALDGGRLTVALPLCPRPEIPASDDLPPVCEPVGAAIAGLDLRALVAPSEEPAGQRRAVAVYDEQGNLLVSDGTVPDTAPSIDERMLRRRQQIDGRDVATVFAPFEVDGERLGTVAVGLPVDSGYGVARGTLTWLAVLLVAAMGAVMGIGVLVTRSVLAQVRELHATSQALGKGDLRRRAPVLADDEVGDLARVLNQMADELQTSHDLLETRVEERTEEVRRLLEQRTEFFASLSHELRTPLAVILSQARMQLDPAFRGRRTGQRAAWDAVQNSAEQLLDEVNAVLALARVNSDRLEVRTSEVGVQALLGELHTMFHPLAVGHGIVFDIDANDGLPDVLADEDQLREVLANLVDNAIKYTPEGGHIRLSAGIRNGSVDITVSDTGVGVPAAVGDRIFEPFYRVPGSSPQHGEPSTGLGLAVTKRLVELQGGTIGIASSSAGTTFTVSLPRSAPAGSARSAGRA